MTNTISNQQLGQIVRQVFIEGDKYLMDKYVPEFLVGGKYFADCFNTTIVEKFDDGKAPVFYHTYSPYDIVSKKAPNQAIVIQDGRVVLDVDFTDYIPKRTSVMSSLVLQGIGKTELSGRLLLVGTGRIAKQALAALAEYFSDLKSVDFLNTSGSSSEFVDFAAQQGVRAAPGSLDQLSEYDYVICHSSAQNPVLTSELRNSVKSGAFIASFVSENFRELAPEYYDTKDANVLIDWGHTIEEAPDLQEAVEKKIANPDRIVHLKDLFSGAKSIDPGKKYTVYRSHGSPMQDLAALKLLMQAS